MPTLKKIFFVSVILILTSSCGDTTSTLSSGQFTKNENYYISSVFSCCGCSAKYFTINSGKRKIEQVIYSYNCYNIGKPTKFIFNYDAKGKLISCNKYVATDSTDYTQPINEQEKQLFIALDTTSILKAKYPTIRLSEVKGFRKPLDKEVTHPFPFIKNGYKLPVN